VNWLGSLGLEVVPFWTIVAEQRDLGGTQDELLSLSAEHGLRHRVLREGRAASEDLVAYKRVLRHDLVINKLSARDGAIAVSEIEGIVSPAYWVFGIDTMRFAPRFLHYLLRSAPYQAEIARRSKSMPPAQFDLPRDQLRTLPIPTVPLDEQRRIADFLDTETTHLDAIVRTRSAQAARVSERAQAVLDVTLSEVAASHGSLPLRRELRAIEQGVSPQCESRPAGLDEPGVLKLSAVNSGQYLEDENKALPEGVAGDRRYEVRSGDLLMSRANTPERVGDVAFVRKTRPGLLLPDLIYRLALGRPSDAEFVATALRSTRVRALLSVTARGTSQSMVKLRGEDIAALPIPAAPPFDRDRAVLTIREADETAHHLRIRISTGEGLLRERRQALITAAVTGQLDVTTARGGRS